MARRIDARSLAALAATLVGLMTCGCGSPEEATSDRGAEASGRVAALDDQALAHLRALGYDHWDEGADAAKRGVTTYDASRASPGYDLYTNDVDEVYLADLQGRRAHTWRLPGRDHCELAEWLENGDIAVVCVGKSLTVLDWDSNVVWEAALNVHHDVAIAPDGAFWVPIQEGPHDYHGRAVYFDAIAQLMPDGSARVRWSTWPHFEELRALHAPSALDVDPEPGREPEPGMAFDYYHLNAVEFLPATPLGERDERFRAGNLLISLRNANLVVIVDPRDGAIVWHWGTDTLELPHMPTMTDDGHLLVFDNGPKRGFSRVLEIDPGTGAEVWSYRGDPPETFFSAWRGSNQRLPNGDTLICESERGHVFEVTPDHRIVWEFWNPDMEGDKRKRIYRFARLPAAKVEGAGRALDRSG